MITITADANQEKLSILDKEIILNGPPSHLQGKIQFANRQEETLRVKSIGLTDKATKGEAKEILQLFFRLRPGEEAVKRVRHNLPIATAPGTYQKYISVGDNRLPVKVIVQPSIKISLSPSRFSFQGTAPGTIHKITLTLENLGNLPFKIPALRHASMLDMDLMCRAFGTGFRSVKDEGVLSTLDVVTENIKSNMVDWVSIKLKEAGQTIEPGARQLLNIRFTVPKNADKNRDYSGNFRFWNREVAIEIKSHVVENVAL
ncbi:MAG: hypothetical protein HWE22_08670 [Flavobacteriales bacterium]|nr:hypothetical protein [Flavobacteriales bacterium]